MKNCFYLILSFFLALQSCRKDSPAKVHHYLMKIESGTNDSTIYIRDNGNKLIRLNHYRNGRLQNYQLYSYPAEGQKEEHWYDSTGKLTSYCVLNRTQNEIVLSSRTENGFEYWRSIFRLDKNGRITNRTGWNYMPEINAMDTNYFCTFSYPSANKVDMKVYYYGRERARDLYEYDGKMNPFDNEMWPAYLTGNIINTYSGNFISNDFSPLDNRSISYTYNSYGYPVSAHINGTNTQAYKYKIIVE